MISKPVTKKNPPYISPSGRFIPYLYRRYKRKKGYEFIISNMDKLLTYPLVQKVPAKVPDSVVDLAVNYSSSICDLKNSNCTKHKMDSVEAEMRRVVNSIIIPRRKAATIANDTSNDLLKVFQAKGYRGNLHLYGSYKTGLCTTHSDIDFIFEFHEHCSGTTPKDIENILKSSNSGFSKVKLIANARVPFIVCEHNRSKKKCNITFENEMGIQNSKLIKLYLSLNPDLKILTIYVKYLLDKYGILGIGRITTHILFWIVVFFMQQKEMLPSVKTVREACSSPYFINGTNCAVPESFNYRSTATSSIDTHLYSLMLDFTKFCRDFRFMKYVMSPYFGKAYRIDLVEKLKGTDSSRNFSPSFINLQHPSNLELNLGRQTGKRSVNVFRIVCCRISKILAHFIRYSKESNLSLDDSLPENFEELPYVMNQPKELVQCASFTLNVDSPEYLVGRAIRTIRKLMENIFDFEATEIVKKYVDRIGNNDEPIVYCFSYSSTPNTWTNDYIGPILPHPKFDKSGEPDRQIDAFLLCEIVDDRKIKVMIESEAHFMNFLDENPRCVTKEDRSNRRIPSDVYKLPIVNMYGSNLLKTIFLKTN